jgi:di/tricarboxylate transporter
MDSVLLLVILGGAIALYVTQVVRIEVTSLGVIVALALTGILEPADALSGFSSPATLTVGSMLVLSAGLQRAGVVDYVGRLLSSRAGSGGVRRVLLMLAVPTVLFSAFINNTPVVALMIPVALTLARRSSVAPSKLLLPLSYFSILAGTCTLFGTSTNILVDQLHRASGGSGIGVFEFAPLGLIYLAVGSAYIFLAAPRLLPERKGLGDLLAVQAPGHFVTEVVLKAGSRYVGKELRQAFPESREVSVLQVVRGEEPHLRPAPDFRLEEADVLFVESSARSITHVFADPDLERGTAVADEERVPLHTLLAGEGLERPTDILEMRPGEPEAGPERVGQVDLRMAEAVITPNSRFIGRRVRRLGLSRKYGVQVLALRRLGRQHQYQLRDFRLNAGDVLLVQGEPAALRLLNEEGDLLLVEGVESTLTFPQKAPVAIGILAGVILIATLGIAPLAVLALAGVGLLIATRCLDARDALRALQPEVVLLLAGTIPLGTAMEKVGLASQAAQALVAAVGEHGPWLLVAGLYVMTSLLTEILSNNATAVLLTPIAIGIAAHLGIDAKPLLVAIAFGSSASFSTPIGYQTNTLIMGPGGYRFTDYLRFGLPMNLIMMVVASLCIPLFWPLRPG